MGILAAPADGLTVDGWVDGLRDAKVQRVTRRVRAMATAGATPSAIAAALKGEAANGVLAQTHRQTLGITRTLVGHVASQVSDAIAARNPRDVLDVRWVSVLDARTSDICQGLSGQVFPAHEGPRPPAHFNCRSTVVPTFQEAG
jgi:SPP1 gp7 family putative phage head morphogenesis protein